MAARAYDAADRRAVQRVVSGSRCANSLIDENLLLQVETWRVDEHKRCEFRALIRIAELLPALHKAEIARRHEVRFAVEYEANLTGAQQIVLVRSTRPRC